MQPCDSNTNILYMLTCSVAVNSVPSNLAVRNATPWDKQSRSEGGSAALAQDHSPSRRAEEIGLPGAVAVATAMRKELLPRVAVCRRLGARKELQVRAVKPLALSAAGR